MTTTPRENLGPAETIIQTILSYTDHMVHNRPGVVTSSPAGPINVQWFPVTHKVEEGQKVVYRLDKVGKKTNKVRVGVMQADNRVLEGGREVGIYRPAGLFPEVVTWLYRQVAEVWKLDNEFCARWASFAWGQEHRDLKVILAAFLLVQSRKGDPVLDGEKLAFYDADFRDVGEAMMLLTHKDGNHMDPKLLVRVEEVLKLPGVAEINRELGFGRSARNAFLGRYDQAVTAWLRFREHNPKMLAGLVKAGFKTTVMDLAGRVHYKPETPRFYEVMHWKQAQTADGRRQIAIGLEMKTDSWEGLNETQVCEKIVKEKPGFKRLTSLLPKGMGLTRAIFSAAIEAGSLSDKDLVILTPTIEELGLLKVQDVRERWERALKAADDMRAANIAKRVQSEEAKAKLNEAADTAVQKAVASVMKDMRIYFIVDISGSMEGTIEAAKGYIARFLQAFPPDKVHVAVFNTAGREIQIQHPSSAGVENAFRGIRAGGSTEYGAGVRALQHYRPLPNEDVLFIFVGDEEAPTFENYVRASGLNPMAFGFVKTRATTGAAGWRARHFAEPAAVRLTATALGIPCVMIDERTFSDPYAIPRTIRDLVAATPVQQVAQVANALPRRETLVDTILKTNLLVKPAWAA